MAYADIIRTKTCDMADVATLIENICSASGNLTFASWTPVIGGSGSMTIAANPTLNFAKYIQIGKLVVSLLDVTCETKGTANTVITYTLPVTAGAARGVSVGRCVQNGGAEDSINCAFASTTVVNVRLRPLGNWAIGTGTTILALAVYEAA